MSVEEAATMSITEVTTCLNGDAEYYQESYGISDVVMLSVLIRMTREYADKSHITLDRVMAGLVAAGEKEEV